uniref:U-box domain-containing protein n=1 Tax=Leersia perrieri TaxID=77586 RepID=A0A0D9VJP8_9ORYZ
MDDPPHLFLCPISMDLMDDPVTVSTGVTYDRRSIEEWLFVYGRTTCPATMQPLSNLDLTPNHTLKRVISSWLDRGSSSSSSSSPSTSTMSSPVHDLAAVATPLSRERLLASLAELEETPFKVTKLKSMRARVAGDVAMQAEFVASGGVRVVGRVMAQAMAESAGDFSAFAACEEAAAVLAALPLSDEASARVVLSPECVRPVMALLQRGGAEARLHAMDILTKVSGQRGEWTLTTAAAGVEIDDVIKSLLELLSDGAASTRLSSRALDVLLDVVARGAGAGAARAKAVEVGAVHVLVELLADAADDRHVTERVLLLLKRLCKRPEGRVAFAEHGLAVAAVARTMLRVSELSTQLAVKVLWLVSVVAPSPSEKVLEDMMLTGAVAKLLGLLHVESAPATKQKTVRMVRIHGVVWRQYPCFPTDFRDYLRLLD